MNILRRTHLIPVAMLMLAITSQSWAATYVITSGNWVSQQSWNRNNAGTLLPYSYDNGDQFPSAVLVGTPGIVQWLPGQPSQQNGTYSGSLVVDENNIVVDGWLSVAGSIANEVRVNSNSWWANEYVDLYIDFGASTASTSAYNCYETVLTPATCAAGGASLTENVFAPLEGNIGVSGAGRYGATFDGEELVIFHEGYSFTGQTPGTDYENTFVLGTSALSVNVVPIPAAAWLFGSALLGLGWIRRKA